MGLYAAQLNLQLESGDRAILPVHSDSNRTTDRHRELLPLPHAPDSHHRHLSVPRDDPDRPKGAKLPPIRAVAHSAGAGGQGMCGAAEVSCLVFGRRDGVVNRVQHRSVPTPVHLVQLTIPPLNNLWLHLCRLRPACPALQGKVKIDPPPGQQRRGALLQDGALVRSRGLAFGWPGADNAGGQGAAENSRGGLGGQGEALVGDEHGVLDLERSPSETGRNKRRDSATEPESLLSTRVQ
mmetsp:Transcript_12904/g.29116  ORF Transcript_12904/g.29116 Transcript_12904/m.29116 type:complete len:238 (-) Transcript_12904:334-1047(-)